jgi:uncharacterized protein
VRDQVDRLARVVSDLLDLTRIEAIQAIAAERAPTRLARALGLRSPGALTRVRRPWHRTPAESHGRGQRMNCPKCTMAMTMRHLGPVQIDECAGCRGVWFDADELRRAKDYTEPDANWLDFEIWTRSDQVQASKATLRCPACDGSLVALRYGDSHVEVDHCPGCGGTWLDGGEFRKIIDGLAREMDSKSAADYVRAAVEEAREILTGSEGVVSEWRDFTTVLRLLQYRFLIENPRTAAAIAEVQRTIR